MKEECASGDLSISKGINVKILNATLLEKTQYLLRALFFILSFYPAGQGQALLI